MNREYQSFGRHPRRAEGNQTSLELVEKLISTEEPTKEEKKAIREKDEIANEEELMKTLGNS